jgi:hypothetical protein
MSCLIKVYERNQPTFPVQGVPWLPQLHFVVQAGRSTEQSVGQEDVPAISGRASALGAAKVPIERLEIPSSQKSFILDIDYATELSNTSRKR